MKNNDYITFNCIEIKQPIGTFYVGSISHSDLISISYTDVRRIEERDVEKVIGIQRPLDDNRVNELRQYVNTIDASFPTAIILAINSENAIFDSKNHEMKIQNEPHVAKVIDGQHRIAGLEKYSGEIFQLNVTVFIDMDIEDQAMVFATINLKQTKVTKSLSYDLYEYAKTNSPQKTCHNIAKLLNSKSESPLYHKIKILGKATGYPEETITQSTFVDRLIKYISKNPIRDRDLLKRGKKIERLSSNDYNNYIFRNLFENDQEAEIAKNIWNYFSAIKKKWPSAWEENIRGNILNRSTGFAALMRFIKPLYNKLNKNGIVSQESFYEIISKIDLNDSDFNSDRYKPGSSGEGALYKDLLEKSGINE